MTSSDIPSLDERSTQSDPSAIRPERSLDIAVIGAGLSGLTCARLLTRAGNRVRVFDKARGPGGRMATRRMGDLRFDHGAQYFTARDPRFRQLIDTWRAEGLVARWPGTVGEVRDGHIEVKDDSTERWVGVPSMSTICRHLATGLDVTYRSRIVHLEHLDNQWQIETGGGEDAGRYEALVLSAPAPQTAALLAAPAPELAALAGGVEMAPCWAVMASFPQQLELDFEGAFVSNSPLRWIARNNSKPGRPPGEAWILHASPEWSHEHLDLDQDVAAQWLTDAFRDAIGSHVPSPTTLAAHRWRFALPVNPLSEPCLFDPKLALVACGDWAGGPRVEGAFLSGSAAAKHLLDLRSTAKRL